jgi:hypothetical protein
MLLVRKPGKKIRVAGGDRFGPAAVGFDEMRQIVS